MRIAGRLPEQIFTRRGQSRQSAAVCPFGGRLILDAPPRVGPIQLLGRKVAKLLVGFVQLHLAVANLQCLAVPLVELLGNPQRVLFRIQHVQDVVGRVNPLAARKVVLGEHAQVDRLRLDSQGLRRERAGGFDLAFLESACRHDAFAFGGSRNDGTVGALPLDADLFDAEIVVGLDAEIELLRVEHHFRARQVLDRQRGGFVVAGRDRQRERLLARQPEFILPLKLDLARAVNVDQRALDHGRGGRLRPAVHAGGGELAACRGGEPRTTSLDQRDRPAAHVFAERSGLPEIGGQRHLGDDRSQLGAEHGLDPHDLPGVADAHLQPALGNLRRQLELIPAVLKRREHRPLRVESSPTLPGMPKRTRRQTHGHLERLSMGNDDLPGQRLEGGEGVSRRPGPRREKSLPGIDGRGGKCHAEADGRRHTGRGEPAPGAMSRIGRRVVEVAFLGIVSNAANGRLTKGERSRLLPLAVNQFDDAQQLVAETGKLRGEQPGELLQAALLPDPAMQVQRYERAAA